MDVADERELSRKQREKKGCEDEGGVAASGLDPDFLEREFDDPEQSDVLNEKHVKEGKRKNG